MQVISVKTLREYWLTHPDVEQALKAWHAEASKSTWRTPDDIKQRYHSADFLAVFLADEFVAVRSTL